MYVTTPVDHKQYEDMMLPEAIQLEERISDELEDLAANESPIAANNRYVLRTWLIGVQDRIGHLTSLLTF